MEALYDDHFYKITRWRYLLYLFKRYSSERDVETYIYGIVIFTYGHNGGSIVNHPIGSTYTYMGYYVVLLVDGSTKTCFLKILLRVIIQLRLAVFLKLSTFSFSVLKSNSGSIVPCIRLVLSMFMVRFSEKSI